jgi:hypothetical protein
MEWKENDSRSCVYVVFTVTKIVSLDVIFCVVCSCVVQ